MSATQLAPGYAPRTVLEARGLVRAFGGVKAVDGLGLNLCEGTITGLIGPNGAGKPTAFNLITGVIRAQAGTVSPPMPTGSS
ncbi:MAG: ATP-binding cassette domain-containing protein [Alphaproteobacteria bacterium]